MSGNSKTYLLSLLALAPALLLSSCQNKELSLNESTVQFRTQECTSLAVTRTGSSEEYTIRSTDGKAALTVISGEYAQSEQITRGVEVTDENLATIGVSTKAANGDDYFTNKKFTKDSEGIFKCSQTYYWPEFNLDCYLYYPYMDNTAKSIWGFELSTDGESPVVTHTTPGNALIHKDLCYGYCSASDGTPAVAMKHLLAAVDFRVGDYIPEGSQVSSFMLKGIVTKGYCILDKSNSYWELDDESSGSITPGMTFYPDSWMMTSETQQGEIMFSDFFIIPQSFGVNCGASVLIDAVDSGGESLQYEFPLDGMNMRMGRRYSFYINFPRQ